MASTKEKTSSTDEEMLVKYIKVITHSGLNKPDRSLMSNIKKLCKNSAILVDKAYQSVLEDLKKKHAEVRNSSFQICIELFPRSHIFRQHILNDLELILELTAGINPGVPLPPPKDVSERLKKLALSTLLQWKTEYGTTHKQLIICCNYLAHSKGIDFSKVRREADEARRIQELSDRELRRVREEKIKKFQEQFDELLPEIETSVDVTNNCLGLLVPTPEDFFLSTVSETEPADIFVNEQKADEFFEPRQFGLSHSYNLTISIDTSKKSVISRTEENSSVIDNMRDSVSQLKKFLPKVKLWLDFCSTNHKSKVESVEYVMKKIECCLNKCKEVVIEGIKMDESDSEDDEDDFVEVKKEGFEEFAIQDYRIHGASGSKTLTKNEKQMGVGKKEQTGEYISLHSKSDGSCKPSTSHQAISSCSNSDWDAQEKDNAVVVGETGPRGDSRKERLLAVAPKLPYDVDLYHWEDKDLVTPMLISSTMDAPKFWGCGNSDENSEIPDPRGTSALFTRTIEFAGQFQPVKWSCRVPLLSGKLCPRQDRVKCPFHGKIVPRDLEGKCMEPGAEPKINFPSKDPPSDEEPPVPDWQDPQLLAELKAATGIDLKMPDKKRKKKSTLKKIAGVKSVRKRKGEPSSDVLEDIKRRNFPGIVTTNKETANVRLMKKIFSRSSMRRVTEELRRQQHRRQRDKFGDQFNYA